MLPFPVVSIGASAGGLVAFTQLLKALPSKSGMAFVLIQHLEPGHESALTALLSKATRMRVVEVSDSLAIEPNHIYIIPPDKTMTMRNGSLSLSPRSKANGVHHPIDEFSITLAGEQANTAIGVVLSGTGTDGTNGLKAIKAAGGVTFAQDPKTAQWPAMPANAIAAGTVDFVLSPERIAAKLVRIRRHPYLTEALEASDGKELDTLCQVLQSSMGVDFRLYKEATVRRRIARRMALQKTGSLGEYTRFLKEHPGEAQALADDIFIHVTRFFRDRECFLALRKQVIAKLVSKKPAGKPIRIWVAGCSTGEEVYSIAMLLFEELAHKANKPRIQIFGTDIRKSAVAKARAGIYSQTAVAGVSPARLKRFFTRTDEGYQIQKFIRELCVFAPHDLASDPPFSKLALISCRNVLIYMGAALQKRVLSTFHYSLRADGFLFLGSSESAATHSDYFIEKDRKHRIFQSAPMPASFQDLNSAASFRHQLAPAVLSASAPDWAADFRKRTEEVLLRQYAPPALVVDPNLLIVHFQGDLSRYLVPATGQPSFHLMKMVRSELLADLRAAIYRARKEGVPVHRDGVEFKYEGKPAAVHLEVQPLASRMGNGQDLLVVFQNVEPAGADRRRKGAGTVEPEAASQERMRILMEEHETAQEEMRAANEEALSANEELQSTNEELETAREELQSSNEELVTLNDELHQRNAELNVLTQDLTNLLVGVDVPVLVLDAGLCVRRFTPTAGALLNLIPGDVGRPFSNIASNLDLAGWNDLFSEVTVEGRSIEREVRSRDGHRYSLRVRPFVTRGKKIEGVLVVLLDAEMISRSRDKAQESADDARSELAKRDLTVRVLLDATPQAIVGVDAAGTIVLVNAGTGKTFGYRAEELIGKPIEILVPESARESDILDRQVFFPNMPGRHMGSGIELEGVRKDGTRFPVEVALSIIDTSAGRLGVVFLSDITQRKQMERVALADYQMETVGKLASGLAHDFNNLLGGILANTDLALAELASSASPMEELQRIRTTTARGSDIVRQLMVYAGQETETLEPVDLSRTVRDMLELLTVLVSKHVRVETLLDSKPNAVLGNPTQIRQIVMNLFSNASDAIGDRDGVIHVTTGRVTVDSDSPLVTSGQLTAGNYVHLEVSDDGRGMALEEQARIFDLFFTTKPIGNHGLGLAVVRRIVQSLHGAIQVSSTPGKGSTFQILLPSEEGMVGAVPAAIAPSASEPILYRGAILVVEDEDLLRQGVSKMLHKRGFSVLEASDGTSALDVVRARKDDIGVLLLDISLPGASSREVYEEAKRLRPDLPVIVTSGNSEKSACVDLAVKIEHFLRKPFGISELIAMIGNVSP